MIHGSIKESHRGLRSATKKKKSLPIFASTAFTAEFAELKKKKTVKQEKRKRKYKRQNSVVLFIKKENARLVMHNETDRTFS